MDNKALLQELTKEGILSEELARKTLQDASLGRRSAEDLIYERRLADDLTVAKIKSRLLGVPFKKVDLESIKDDFLKVVPEEVVRNYRAIPIGKSQELLTVGMLNPDDPKAQEALKFIAKKLAVNLGVYLITYSDWESVLRRYSPYRSEVDEAIKSLNFQNKNLVSPPKVIKLEEGAAVVSEEAPIIRIVASTLKEAVWQKASDIHIEPQRNSLRIRFRLDGELESVSLLPIELHQLIVSRVKVLSDLKLDETRIPQDGRFRTVLAGRDIDFRVSTFPTAVGEKVAIRVLDPTVGLKGLEGLGLTDENLTIIKKGISRPYGMVLLTGPTGSGKTTTLYAVMQILNKENVNIVSLEDPVEYFIEGVNQSQVRPEIGYDFASGLRQILRQDPDIIMVGEIRDEETAGLAVHAALTGHIVLSTLHTNNSLGVIPRLIDMKVEPFLLPPSLNLMLAQRLISKLCDKCRKVVKASPQIQEIVKRELDQLPKEIIDNLNLKGYARSGMGQRQVTDSIGRNSLSLRPTDSTTASSSFDVYVSPGCEACRGKGTGGRIALFEVFAMTPELEKIISTGPTESRILEEARRQGMITLRQDGIIKALKGLVSIEEVLKETIEVY